MALKDTVRKMYVMLEDLERDLLKASEKGNKTASQRFRTNSIKFAKLSKQYRQESMVNEYGLKKRKKVAKKKALRQKSVKRSKKVARRG